ncbi:c-type cytochrome [Sorangium sp. So ce385]|uniref:c-type cytochrome n=1 Tax=Sorangium sp. So ce385 TaxID=3133308 RepID=UPI003F5B91DF
MMKARVATWLVALAAAAIAGCDDYEDWFPSPDSSTATGGFAGGFAEGFAGGFSVGVGGVGGGSFGDQHVDVSAVPPPPISGGTLLVTADKDLVVAADPDRDRISIIDLGTLEVETVLPLEEGDEPGRVTEGPPGTAHVALRRGGAVVTIDLATQQMHRRPVCPAPRGVAYDAAADLLHVACAGGELVTLSSDLEAPPVRELRLDRDLRDVVIEGDALLVSRFRSSELLVVSDDGAVAERVKPPVYVQERFGRTFEPAVAWRTIPLPGGGVAMVHQRSLVNPIDIDDSTQGGYSGFDCSTTVVQPAVTLLRPLPSEANPTPASPAPGAGGLPFGLLPVDMAISPDGFRGAIVMAGSRTVIETPLDVLEQTEQTGAVDDCASFRDQRSIPVPGEPIAVGYDEASNLLVQLREPPSVLRFGAVSGAHVATFLLPGERRLDSGHALFHGIQDVEVQMAIACASCHPEGQDDGRSWSFNPIGARRTQSLVGGILETAPLHWDGDMTDLDAIMSEVFEQRMGGIHQRPERVEAFASWLDTIKPVPVSEPADPAAVQRGEALFEDAAVGCASCHSGEKLTNDQTVDVGTGKAFQVPSLRGLAARAPYMHDGCAATLHDRFGPCGGGDKHGVTSTLTPAQIDDLVAYLETL